MTKIFIADMNKKKIYVSGVDSISLTTLISGIEVWDVTYDSSERKLYWAQRNAAAPDEIWKSNADASDQTLVFSSTYAGKNSGSLYGH